MKPLSERIKIEQAFLEGKEIEMNHGNFWKRLDPHFDNHVFMWHKFDYRIKPEPRVIYMNEYEGSGLKYSGLYETREVAERNIDRGPGYIRTIRFIEDLEGD